MPVTTRHRLPATSLSTLARALVALLTLREKLRAEWFKRHPELFRVITAEELLAMTQEKLDRDTSEEMRLVDQAIKSLGDSMHRDDMVVICDLVEEQAGEWAAVSLDHRWDGVNGWCC